MFDHATAQQQHFDQRLEAFKAGVHKLFEKATTRPTWFGRATAKSAEMVKAHPIVAIGIGLGLGYIIVRSIRR